MNNVMNGVVKEIKGSSVVVSIFGKEITVKYFGKLHKGEGVIIYMDNNTPVIVGKK